MAKKGTDRRAQEAARAAKRQSALKADIWQARVDVVKAIFKIR